MKKAKKCYRTMTADNYTPMDCMKGECMAWMETKHLSGCVFVLHAATSIGRNLDATKKGTDDGDDIEDRACDGQCKEGGAASVKGDRTQNDSGNTTQKDPAEEKSLPKYINPWK